MKHTKNIRRKCAGWIAALLIAVSPLAATARPRPNIVFVLADDLGFGDVSFQPFAQTNVLSRLRTPGLARLAEGGVTLTSHYAAAPVCAPSRASRRSPPSSTKGFVHDAVRPSREARAFARANTPVIFLTSRA